MSILHIVKCAEDYPVGTMLEWPEPPPVRDEPFIASSHRGCVYSHRIDKADGFITKHAIVRFWSFGAGWSDPLELTAGLPCSVWSCP